LAIAIRPEQYSRQLVVDVLRDAEWPELADEASRNLPDPVDVTHLEAWATLHGFSFEDVKSRFGSSGGSA
jgi:hypothetical protein